MSPTSASTVSVPPGATLKLRCRDGCATATAADRSNDTEKGAILRNMASPLGPYIRDRAEKVSAGKLAPMPIDEAAFKQALSHFASGVTIVTTEHSGRPFGMTVASFASVSLRPPLVLVCIEKNVKTHDAI